MDTSQAPRLSILGICFNKRCVLNRIILDTSEFPKHHNHYDDIIKPNSNPNISLSASSSSTSSNPSSYYTRYFDYMKIDEYNEIIKFLNTIDDNALKNKVNISLLKKDEEIDEIFDNIYVELKGIITSCKEKLKQCCYEKQKASIQSIIQIMNQLYHQLYDLSFLDKILYDQNAVYLLDDIRQYENRINTLLSKDRLIYDHILKQTYNLLEEPSFFISANGTNSHYNSSIINSDDYLMPANIKLIYLDLQKLYEYKMRINESILNIPIADIIQLRSTSLNQCNNIHNNNHNVNINTSNSNNISASSSASISNTNSNNSLLSNSDYVNNSQITSSLSCHKRKINDIQIIKSINTEDNSWLISLATYPPNQLITQMNDKKTSSLLANDKVPSLIITGSTSGSIRLFNFQGKFKEVLHRDPDSIITHLISIPPMKYEGRDYYLLVSLDFECNVTVWDLVTMKKLHMFSTGHEPIVGDAIVVPIKSKKLPKLMHISKNINRDNIHYYLATVGGMDGHLKVWNIWNKSIFKSLNTRHKDGVSSMLVLPFRYNKYNFACNMFETEANCWLFTVGKDYFVKIWSLPTFVCIAKLEIRASITAIAISSTIHRKVPLASLSTDDYQLREYFEPLIIFTDTQRNLGFYDIKRRKLYKQISNAHNMHINKLEILPRSFQVHHISCTPSNNIQDNTREYLISISKDMMLKIWDITTAITLRTINTYLKFDGPTLIVHHHQHHYQLYHHPLLLLRDYRRNRIGETCQYCSGSGSSSSGSSSSGSGGGSGSGGNGSGSNGRDENDPRCKDVIICAGRTSSGSRLVKLYNQLSPWKIRKNIMKFHL